LRRDDLLLVALPGTATKKDAVAALTRAPVPSRVLLISTTGYYGSPKGLVDEETPAGEELDAQAIAAVEEEFRLWAGEAGVILRLGGLYRPGRGPFAALARRGTVSRKPANRTLPLIHYEDAATAVATALRRDKVAPIYLTLTPPCPSRQAFFEAAAARLGIEPPPFAPPLPGPPARYDATLLRRDLLPRPAYPSWQAALTLP
jgi:nucleoside-diphosphate-sugar epimerase